MNLKEMISADKEKISAAQDIYLVARQAYESLKSPIEAKQRQLLNRFKDVKNREIEAEHGCDCCRPRYYSDACFTKDGITLWTDADHPNDRREEDFNWEEVGKILTA